jgi:hypothetical protein
LSPIPILKGRRGQKAFQEWLNEHSGRYDSVCEYPSSDARWIPTTVLYIKR